MKPCPRCENVLPLSAFAQRRGGGHSSFCKSCQREYSKEHYRKNKERHNERRARNRYGERKRHLEFIRAAKDRPCADCGGSHPYWAMDFDHIRGTKLFNIANATRAGKSLKAIKAEIDKCEVVCALCHRYRTHGRGENRGVG